jgi:hypothetical protein
MSIFDKLEKSNGGYIFLSHSHKDFPKVRQIRNTLEKCGFEPLCFYLKCLDDDSEIEDLIKREIDAREWFIYVDSENARNSKWVTLEREYINRTNQKKILRFELDDLDAAGETVEKISRNLRVFLTHSHADRIVADKIKKKLIQKDFLVFDEKNINSIDRYEESVVNFIAQLGQEGCVIALISEKSVQSNFVKRELNYAIQCNCNVIPVFLGKPEIPLGLKLQLQARQHYFLSEAPSDQEIENMIEQIANFIVK